MADIERQVAVGADDGVWGEGNLSFSASETYGEFGYYEYGPESLNWFGTFLDVTISPGATILSAKLSFKAYYTDSLTTVNVRICAVDADSPAAPTTYNEAENATRTTATVDWDNVGSWTTDNWYDSPDITSVIQELVNRPGWSSGNNMVLYVEDHGTTPQTSARRRRLDAAGVDGNEAAKLIIEYSGATPKSVSDSGSGSEQVEVVHKISVSDAGSGAEVLTRDKDTIVSDAGSGTEVIAVDKPYGVVQDAGAGTEDVRVNKNFTVSDTGEGRAGVQIIKGSAIETRNHPHTSKWYLAVKRARIIWKGTVSTGKNRGWDDNVGMEDDQLIYITGGANEAGFDVNNFVPDLTAWIGSVDDADHRKDHGICRVRAFSGNNLKVSADMTCVWKAGDTVCISDLHDLWPMPHKVSESGGVVTVLKDHDLPHTDRHERPVPIMGPPACAFIVGGVATVYFHGAASYKVQPGSAEFPAAWTSPTNGRGIKAWSWWFEGGTPGTSSAQNPTVTWDTPGQYVVRLQVTGHEGYTEKGFRNVFVFDRIGANAPTTDFHIDRLSGSLSNHGWEADVEVFGENFDADEIPNEAQAVIFAEEWFNGTAKTFKAGNPGTHGRENIKLVGWITDTRLSYSAGKVRGATMTIRGLQEYLQGKTNFPVYWTQIETEAPPWAYFDTGASPTDGLTVRKCWYHLLRWHWTVFRFTDVFIPDDHNNYLAGQNFPEGTLTTHLDGFCKDTQARWAVDKGGALHIFSWGNWLPVSGAGAVWRSRLHTNIELTHVDFESLEIEPRLREQIARVRVEGVMATCSSWYDISVDMAPGDIRGYKGGTTVLSNQVLGTGGAEGTQGWELARMVYAEESRLIERIRLRMCGNYSHFDIVPYTDYFKLTVSPSKGLRGIEWSEKPFWVTEMELSPNTQLGDVATTLTGLPETSPEGDILVYADDVGGISHESPLAGGYAFPSLMKKIAAPQTIRLPALMGGGGDLIEGKEIGTTWVRLLGDMKLTVLAENRGFHEMTDRPVVVEFLPPDRAGGWQSPLMYRIVDVRRADDDEANATFSRGIVQHFVSFCVPGTVAVAGPAAPPFIINEFTYKAKTIQARVNTAPTGTALIATVKKDAVTIGSVTIGDGSTGGSTTLSDKYVEDGDVLTLHVSQVGSTAAGVDLTVQLELWAHGI